VGVIQVDREDNWDDYIILQAYVASAVHLLPFLYCSNGVCHAYANFPCVPLPSLSPPSPLPLPSLSPEYGTAS